MVIRTYEEELEYIERINDYSFRIKKGFQVLYFFQFFPYFYLPAFSPNFVSFLFTTLQPNMNVEGIFYVNKNLEGLMFDELKNSCNPTGMGGFLPGVKQIANVAALPGIVGK